MSHTKIESSLFENIMKSVERVDKTSWQLVEVMDRQIDAIIASEAVLIEELTRAHSKLIEEFEQHENALIESLENALGANDGKDRTIKLEALKTVYPEHKAQIEQWKHKIKSNSKLIQQKHDQLLRLLEFALEQNEHMISSIFRMFSDGNASYGTEGMKSNGTASIVINQQI